MALSPLFVSVAQAGTFSFIESLFSKVTPVTNAQGSAYNSQTMPLLAAAVNLDPNPAVGGGNITMTGDGSALVSQDGPSGTVADITNAPASSQISVYTVHAGDSIGSIAKMFGVTSNTIVWANDIKGGIVHQGDVLIILPVTGIQHKIASGETVDSLAKTFKSTAQDITAYNDIADGAALTVGETILIPNGVVPPTPAQVAATKKSKAVSNIASGKTKEAVGGAVADTLQSIGGGGRFFAGASNDPADAAVRSCLPPAGKKATFG